MSEATDRRVRRAFRQGISDFHLIEPGDSLLIGLSGGKDSLALLDLLAEYRRSRRDNFALTALHVRMTAVDYASDPQYLNRFCWERNVELLVRTATFEPDRQENRTPCFLCSWHRRKLLWQIAQERGCDKIALGHHQDDIIHTALLNLFHAGSFSTMPARLRLRKFPLTIVRPLCRVREDDLQLWAAARNYLPIVKHCPYEQQSRRTDMRTLFAQVERLNPEARYSFFHALEKASALEEE